MNDISCKKKITKKVTNFEELNEEHHCVDWETLLLGRSVEDMWNNFSSILKSFTEKHTHTKSFIEYPSKPWIDKKGPPKPQESLKCPELHDFFKMANIPGEVTQSIESKEVLQICALHS
ncbi:hypothetical protein HHI36_022397 [Cryptolaemus montrouzieri]|uniref:Uncharacterized protein n=1 Tax=Cryptolaemus montrouzieri TaxID=559131 RepID=A0ABD2N0G4_9CUCU